MALGVIDVCAAAGALYVLLPKGHGLGFLTFTALYSFAAMLGIASHAPGGLGVFEATMLNGVGGSSDQVLASLLLFRGIYYVAPFVLAMALLGAYEAVRRWRSLREAMAATTSGGRGVERARLIVASVRVERFGSGAMASKETSARALAEHLLSPFAAKLVGAMPEPAVIVGADGCAVAANKPAFALLPAIKIGEPFILALRTPDVIDALRRVMASGEAETVLWSERVPIERLFEVCVAPLAAEAGEVVATLLTLRDLTESRRVERMRADFIANASHELRTPLASMLGFIETLQGSARDDLRRATSFSPSCASKGAAWRA